MKLKEIHKLMETHFFFHEEIKRKEFFMMESFLSENTPDFWVALTKQKKSVHSYSITYDKSHDFNVFLFKTKDSYSIAYFEEINEKKSDLIVVNKSDVEKEMKKIIMEELKVSSTVLENQEKRKQKISEIVKKRARGNDIKL